MSQNLTYTLSRWHHIAARLSAMLEQNAKQAQDVLFGTRITAPIDEEQQQALAARGQNALSLLTDMEAVTKGLSVIRAALAASNAQVGVSNLLAEVEALRTLRKHLRGLPVNSLLTMPSLANANEALSKQVKTDKIRYSRDVEPDGLAVRVVGLNDLNFVETRVRALDLRIQQLTDEIADLNKTSLSLELDEALLKLLDLN